MSGWEFAARIAAEVQRAAFQVIPLIERSPVAWHAALAAAGFAIGFFALRPTRPS